MTSKTSSPWSPSLTQTGYLWHGGEGGYRRNGTLFYPGGRWPFLRSSKPVPGADPLRGHLGRPGPWKLVRLAGKSGRYLVFDLLAPPGGGGGGGDGDGDGDDASSLYRGCLDWAEATFHGRLPEGWAAPRRADVEALAPPGSLTVGVGPVVRQVELVCRPDRLALRVPLVPRIPDDLAPARLAWLEANLRDGQDRWRLVRLGLSEGPAAAWAEVDLTGCPAGLLEGLVPSGLEALRWVSAWLLLPLAFLADPAVGSPVGAWLDAEMIREKEDE